MMLLIFTRAVYGCIMASFHRHFWLKFEVYQDTLQTNFWMFMCFGRKRWRLVSRDDLSLLHPRYLCDLNPVFPADLNAFQDGQTGTPRQLTIHEINLEADDWFLYLLGGPIKWITWRPLWRWVRISSMLPMCNVVLKKQKLWQRWRKTQDFGQLDLFIACSSIFWGAGFKSKLICSTGLPVLSIWSYSFLAPDILWMVVSHGVKQYHSGWKKHLPGWIHGNFMAWK